MEKGDIDHYAMNLMIRLEQTYQQLVHIGFVLNATMRTVECNVHVMRDMYMDEIV